MQGTKFSIKTVELKGEPVVRKEKSVERNRVPLRSFCCEIITIGMLSGSPMKKSA